MDVWLLFLFLHHQWRFLTNFSGGVTVAKMDKMTDSMVIIMIIITVNNNNNNNITHYLIQ